MVEVAQIGNEELQRLLKSEFFSPWDSFSLIWSFTRAESVNVGLLHAILARHRQLPPCDSDFLLPQLCHLLVSSEEEYPVLENFILERAQQDLHSAVYTLWALEHSLADYRDTFARDAKFYLRTVRILGDLQKAVFGSLVASPTVDFVSSVAESLHTLGIVSSPTTAAPAIDGIISSDFPDVDPSLVGAGMALIGALLPSHASPARSMVLTEARRLFMSHSSQILISNHAVSIRHSNSSAQDDQLDLDGDFSNVPHAENDLVFKKLVDQDGEMTQQHRHCDIETSLKGSKKFKSIKGYLAKAAKSLGASVSIPDSSAKIARLPSHMALSGTGRSKSSNISLLRSKPLPPPSIPLYYSSDMQLVTNLLDVSHRLVSFPKDQRSSALRTELSLINHNLPASICLSLWCGSPVMSTSNLKKGTESFQSIFNEDANKSAVNYPNEWSSVPSSKSDYSDDYSNQCKDSNRHHRVLSVCVNDAVVLNSAERVPYLVQVEVLESNISDQKFFEIIGKLLAFRKPSSLRNSVQSSSESSWVPQELAFGDENATHNTALPLENDHLNVNERIETSRDEIIDRSLSKRFGIDSSSDEFKVEGKGVAGIPTSVEPHSTNFDSSPSNLTSKKSVDECLNPKHFSENESFDTIPISDDDYSSSKEMPITDGDGTTDFTQRMRTAAHMLALLARQAAKPGCTAAKKEEIARIKDGIMSDMLELERTRLLEALRRGGENRLGNNEHDEDSLLDIKQCKDLENLSIGTCSSIEDVNLKNPKGRKLKFQQDDEDPSAASFREDWAVKEERIRRQSLFGHLSGWRLISVVVKSGADMRQEQLACQLLQEMLNIWREAGLPLWLYPMRVLSASETGGLVETVPNAVSLHSIKKLVVKKHSLHQESQTVVSYSVRDHFLRTFGSPDSEPFKCAQESFVKSLAAYSLATYILQVKDRHDGNILLDNEGHLIHIDFGFMLSNSPGYVGFETAPFKLSPEYIELMGGMESSLFARFKDLLFTGLLALRKKSERIILLVEIMQRHSRLPCFYAGEACVTQLRQRFHKNMTEKQLKHLVERLVIGSAYSVFTRLYDTYQYYSHGIL